MLLSTVCIVVLLLVGSQQLEAVRSGCPKENGFCVLPSGGDQNSGVIKLDSVDGNTAQQQAKCLAKCLAHEGATGCEEIWHQGNRGCYVHTQSVARGNLVGRHACWIFSKCTVNEDTACPKENGFCVFPNGADQNSGVVKLDAVDGNSLLQQAKCLSWCKAYPGATGCEEIWHQGNRGCYVHTQSVARGNGVHRHACWIFSKCKTTGASVQWNNDGAAKSYDDMRLSCQNKGKRLCYFKEVCPNGGPNIPPIDGQKDSTDQWSPIVLSPGDLREDWIQVGGRVGGMCNLLTTYHSADLPNSWMTSRSLARWKKIYPCCDLTTTGDLGTRIEWYTDGAAKTYNQIKGQCVSRSQRLCYFLEVCPNGGPNEPPVGGRQHAGDMWSPIQMSATDHSQNWIQDGNRAGGMCNLLTAYHPAAIPGSWMVTNSNRPYKGKYPCCW